MLNRGELDRSRTEADTAWERVRRAMAVIQRLIDTERLPYTVDADLREARGYLGDGLKALNGTRHRLELAALLVDKLPPLYTEAGQSMTERDRERTRDLVERHYRNHEAIFTDGDGYICLTPYHRIHPVTYACYVQEIDTSCPPAPPPPNHLVPPPEDGHDWIELDPVTEAGMVYASLTIYLGQP